MPHSGNICQAILIPYEFNLGWKTEQVIIKKGFNVKADGERGWKIYSIGLWQDTYLRFFKVSYSIKPLYVAVVSVTAKVQILSNA